MRKSKYTNKNNLISINENHIDANNSSFMIFSFLASPYAIFNLSLLAT